MAGGYQSACLQPYQVKRDFLCGDVVVLTLCIESFKVDVSCSRAASSRINSCLIAQAEQFARYAEKELYCQAVKDYHNAQKEGYPFHAYTAQLQHQAAYNCHCHLSMYRDEYIFTGGAHGNTIRRSNTWDLRTGAMCSLAHFMCCKNYRKFVLEEILCQADAIEQQNPGVYFEDYRKKIVQCFDECNFYLTDEGIAIYYQQYDIAPYAAGIQTFIIPYSCNVKEPSCC